MSAGEQPEDRTEDAPDGRPGDRAEDAKDGRPGGPPAAARETERQRRGSGRAEPEARDATAAAPEPATPLTQQVGRIIVAIVAILFLVFSFFNVHEVEVNWLLAETATPLIILLIGAFLVGLFVGAGIFWRRQHVRTRLERRERPPGREGKAAS